MSEYTDDELVKALQEWGVECGRIIAREVIWLQLRTADGCLRTIQWQGPPPREFRTALPRSGAGFKPPSELVWEQCPLRQRAYELRGRIGQRTFEYVEVVV